ncbi:MAG TPA: FecR domain-containing protein [Pyrinomonadaceae bacterium]|nr:FecR domain-containing protein [Pyrinomonadaceae bacterium]
MKRFRITPLRTLLTLAFVCACAFGAARADTRDLRVISARAGGVNLVSGDVKVRRAASADWLALSSADELKGGDTVRTGPDGRVEVLLNPGSYFRAGGGTEFTLASADLGDLRVELARGSAVIEATGYGDTKIFLEVQLPGALVKIERSGVYRLNAPAGGPAEVFVTKGRAVVAGTLVKGGKVARVSGAGVEVAKFDKKQRDELDLWSRDRGKELAKANERLSRRAMQTAFGMSSFSGMFSDWGNTNGFWFFNSSLRCYTFLPYGYGWRSPYGYGYNTGVYVSPGNGGGYAQPGTASNPGGGTYGGGSSGVSGPGGSGNGGGRSIEMSPKAHTPMTPREPMTPRMPVERPIHDRGIQRDRPSDQ